MAKKITPSPNTKSVASIARFRALQAEGDRRGRALRSTDQRISAPQIIDAQSKENPLLPPVRLHTDGDEYYWVPTDRSNVEVGSDFSPRKGPEDGSHNWLQRLGEFYRFHFSGKFVDDIEWVRTRPGAGEAVVQFRDGTRLRDTGRAILISGRPSPAKAALLVEVAFARGLEEVHLRGPEEFKKDMATECYRSGIRVLNAELAGFVATLERTHGPFIPRGRNSAPESDTEHQATETTAPAPRVTVPEPMPENPVGDNSGSFGAASADRYGRSDSKSEVERPSREIEFEMEP